MTNGLSKDGRISEKVSILENNQKGNHINENIIKIKIAGWMKNKSLRTKEDNKNLQQA